MTGPDAAAIRASLQPESTLMLDRLELFAEVDSTNTYLINQPSPPPGKVRVVLADHQSAGRGRRDRHWHSVPGASLCLSLSYCFNKAPQDLPALTLAIGVGLADALLALGVAGIQLKWPNDLLVDNAKLGGILTETRHRAADGVTVVVGIGINLHPGSVPDEASPWAGSATCLATVMQNVPSRECLSAIVIESLMSTLREFEAVGFANTIARFADYDWLHGKLVGIEYGDGKISGIAAGVGEDGALLVDTQTGQRSIHSGSVSYANPAGLAQ